MSVGLGSLEGWRKLWHIATGIIYPSVCHGCGARLRPDFTTVSLDHWVCPSCQPKLAKLEDPFCQRCGEAYDGAREDSFRCDNCRDRVFSFEFARAGYLAEGLVREAVHGLKYNGRYELRLLLAALMRDAFEDSRLAELLLSKPLLVPVPLHHTRLRQRGFNQSLVLAKELGRLMNLPVIDVLCRQRPTQQQASLTRKQRLANLSKAFSLPQRKAAVKLRGRTVILVDDVFTTGSTANECAKVLKRDGKAEKVVVVTAARG
jgi:competence protein ComFC